MSVTAYVTNAQLTNLRKGKSINLTNKGDTPFLLYFNNDATMSRYIRNIRLGKATRVNLDDFEDIFDSHTGGSIFSKRNMRKVRNGFKDLGNKIKNNSFIRDVGKATIVAGTTAGGMFAGGPMGAIVGGVAGQRLADKSGLGLYGGAGIKKDTRKLNRQVRKGLKTAGRAISRELKPIAKELFKDVKRHATQKMKEQIADAIQTEYMPALNERLDHYTGDTYYSDRLNHSARQALANNNMLHDEYGGYDGQYTGMGLRVVPRVGRQTLTTRGRVQKLPTTRQQHVNEAMGDAQEYEAIGGVVHMTDVQKRMANVRAHKGGSLISDAKRGFRKIKKNEATRYLGGSMLPLR